MRIDAEYIKSLSLGFHREDETEKRKLDVKSKWYELTNKEEMEEFCKGVWGQ